MSSIDRRPRVDHARRLDPVRSGGAPPATQLRPRGWIDERLDIRGFYETYGRKVFPVHSTFFLGEIALFAFIILVVTGVYLGLIYAPSNVDVEYEGQQLPEAYASVQLIESIPVANLFRNVHHWAAHVMIAAIFLHMIRIYFTGTHRKPREMNWIVGIVLLSLALVAGFVGYSLPYDSYAVTATGIGYSIARSIPWIGEYASETFFGGNFPTLGSLPRLYTIHVFILPAIITAVMALHLLIIVKQKHTQPGYSRRIAEPGRVLGVPLWPYQALLAVQLLLLMFGLLFLLAAFVPPHPLDAYGPPGPASREVKPDWYLLWVYGFLKLIPGDLEIELLGDVINAEFIGGMVFPGIIFTIIALAPWLDRTNRRALQRFEYLEPSGQAPIRTAAGLSMITCILTLFLAAYYDEIGMSLAVMWGIFIVAPIVVFVATYAVIRRMEPAPEARFEPRAEDTEVDLPDHAARSTGVSPAD